MSEWKRSTCEVSLDGLPADIKTEVKKHIELYNLGDILSDAMTCVQTDSEKAKKGLFGSVEVAHQLAVLTPRWLIWVVSGSKTPVTVTSTLLGDIVVQDYANIHFAKLIPDSGIEVRGKFTDVAENISAFLGLDDNEVGKMFKEIVIGAVQNAKK